MWELSLARESKQPIQLQLPNHSTNKKQILNAQPSQISPSLLSFNSTLCCSSFSGRLLLKIAQKAQYSSAPSTSQDQKQTCCQCHNEYFKLYDYDKQNIWLSTMTERQQNECSILFLKRSKHETWRKTVAVLRQGRSKSKQIQDERLQGA